jgi:hypothetical protein
MFGTIIGGGGVEGIGFALIIGSLGIMLEGVMEGEESLSKKFKAARAAITMEIREDSLIFPLHEVNESCPVILGDIENESTIILTVFRHDRLEWIGINDSCFIDCLLFSKPFLQGRSRTFVLWSSFERRFERANRCLIRVRVSEMRQ